MLTSLFVIAGLVMTPPAGDPEAAAEAAFTAESTAFGPLERVACWVDPSGVPISCYGVTATATLVVGIAGPGEPFTFTEFQAAGASAGSTPAAATTTFGDGLWLVGTDIQPGTYRTTAVDGCYWERLSGLDGSFDSIIANDFIDGSGQALVEILPTDVAFSSEDCGTWELLP